jgi:release factor glutamine methyltransferase
MVVKRLESEPLKPGASVLDLCTGSGVLAVAAARLGAANVVAVDVSRRAVLAARLNARFNGVTVDAVRGDLFACVQGERFDVIVSNPPYLPSASETETRPRGAARAWEGGRDGRRLIDRICAEAHLHLNPEGVLLLVHSSVCGVQATMSALSGRGLRTTVVDRRRGGLGPRMRARAARLHQRGLLPDGDVEELLVIRAQRLAEPALAPRGSSSRGGKRSGNGSSSQSSRSSGSGSGGNRAQKAAAGRKGGKKSS